MLEGSSYLISRVFKSSCEEQSNWHNMNYDFLESSLIKKRLLDEVSEEEEEDVDVEMVDQGKKRKSPEHPETPDIEDMDCLVDNSDNQGDNGDQDSGAIINPLGSDLTIKCLVRVSRSDYGALASLNSGFHQLVRSGELYHFRRQEDITEHWVYFSCNAPEWQAYDPYRQRWIRVPRMPFLRSFGTSDKESVAVGTDLLVFGMEMNSYTVLKYSILTNDWSLGIGMNSPRCMFGSASIGVKAIIAGGTNDTSSILSSAELYNCVSQTWETLPSMNKARMKCSGVFMDGKFYVIGGVGTNKEVLTCGEEYDLERRTWTRIPDMSTGLIGADGAPPLVAVVNNQLYAAHYAEKTLKKYDKVANTWITLGSLPERSTSVNGWGLAFRACGERLIVIGGVRACNGGMIELNSWIPNDGPPEWTFIARRHSGSFVFNCAVMGC